MRDRDHGLTVPLEVTDDGRVLHGGHVVARFEGPSLVASNGEVVFRVADDGRITGARAEPGDHFDGDDHLHFRHDSVWLQDHGHVRLNSPDKGAMVALRDDGRPLFGKTYPAQFVGMVPASQRAALVCFMLLQPRDRLLASHFGAAQ